MKIGGAVVCACEVRVMMGRCLSVLCAKMGGAVVRVGCVCVCV